MNKLEYIPGDIVKIEYGEATGKIGFVTNTFLTLIPQHFDLTLFISS